MHRNTFLLVLTLSIVAALLVGVNIGRKFRPTDDQPLADTPVATPTASTVVAQTTFTSSTCGISLTLPPGTTVAAEATNGAQFVNPDATVVLLGCEKDIPKLALPPEKIETIQVASIAAKLYHTTSTKDGTPFDALIFTNPKNSMDIYLTGLGSTFSAIVKSITILP